MCVITAVKIRGRGQCKVPEETLVVELGLNKAKTMLEWHQPLNFCKETFL